MQTNTVLIAIIVAIFSITIFHWVKILAEKVKVKIEKKEAANKASTDAMLELTKYLVYLTKILEETTTMQEKILTGTTKACEAIAVTTENHRVTVAAFGKLLLSGSAAQASQADKEALTQPSEEDRDRLHAEMAYRAQGHSPDEARVLADADVEREASFPAF